MSNNALVDCVWGGWSSYGQCNSCQQYRSRTVVISAKNNGTCNGLGRESKSCGTSKQNTFFSIFSFIA